MDEQQLQEQIVQLVQNAMQGDQEATQKIQQIMQAAQQGDQQAVQLAQMIQQVAQQMQQVQSAKFGAKLNYVKQLKGKCPIGYEMRYYKVGGKLCSECIKEEKESKKPLNPIDAFKCGRKMKKKACGGYVKKNQQGDKMVTYKSSGFLPQTLIYRTIQYPDRYEEGVPDTTYSKRVHYFLPFIDDYQEGRVTHDRVKYWKNQYNKRLEPEILKVSPSGRSISGKYNQLRDEYNKMK